MRIRRSRVDRCADGPGSARKTAEQLGVCPCDLSLRRPPEGGQWAAQRTCSPPPLSKRSGIVVQSPSHAEDLKPIECPVDFHCGTAIDCGPVTRLSAGLSIMYVPNADGFTFGSRLKQVRPKRRRQESVVASSQAGVRLEAHVANFQPLQWMARQRRRDRSGIPGIFEHPASDLTGRSDVARNKGEELHRPIHLRVVRNFSRDRMMEDAEGWQREGQHDKCTRENAS
jgi:hypothetical protein